MDNLAYLNNISAGNKPEKIPFFKTKIFKYIIITVPLVAAFVIYLVIMIKIITKPDDRYPRLSYRLENATTIINDYSPYIKSADLRSANASLNTLLNSLRPTVDDITEYNEEVYKEETKKFISIQNELETSKYSKTFDQAYANNMDYYLTTILSLSNDILKNKNDKSLNTQLNSIKPQLELLVPTFDKFIKL